MTEDRNTKDNQANKKWKNSFFKRSYINGLLPEELHK